MRLRLRALPVALVGIALLVAAAPGPVASAATCSHAQATPRTKHQLADARAAVLCLVNRERTKRHLKALKRNSLLQKVGTTQSKDMVRRHYFDHTTPSGRTFQDRLADAHWHGSEAGENIAWGSGSFGTPAKTVSNWMHSSGHRANILRRAFTRAGVGIVAGAPQKGVDGPAATYSMEYDRP